jgi:hypothetical protein
MANRRSIPHDDIIMLIKARVAWRQKAPERWEHCAAYDPKEACGGETIGNALFKQQREREMD